MIGLAYSKDTYKHILLKTMHPKDESYKVSSAETSPTPSELLLLSS